MQIILHMIFLPTHNNYNAAHMSALIQDLSGDACDFVPHIFLLPTYPFKFFNTFFAISSVSHIHLMLFLFHVLLCCKAPLFYLLSPVLRSSLRQLYRFQKLIISGIKSSINSSRQNIASAIKVISMRGKKALNEDEVDEDE